MPRVCTICTHLERAAIDRALVAGETFRHIALQHDVSTTALQRHKSDHLPASLVAAQASQDASDALDVMTELRRCFERMNLLFDACDRWLRDPDDPTRYDVGPRAENVTVIYSEPGPQGKPVQRKDKLSTLLAKLNETGLRVEWVETKHADPRDLIVKTAGRMEGHIRLLGELIGQLEQARTVNIMVNPQWIAIRGAVMDALSGYPEARVALAARLMALEAPHVGD